MTFNVIVAYPRKEGSTFNKEYYVSTHGPLVTGHWKKHGLKGYVVNELNADGLYSYMVTLSWESAEDLGRAANSMAEIMGDVPNFSNELAMFFYGPAIASETF